MHTTTHPDVLLGDLAPTTRALVAEVAPLQGWLSVGMTVSDGDLHQEVPALLVTPRGVVVVESVDLGKRSGVLACPVNDRWTLDSAPLGLEGDSAPLRRARQAAHLVGRVLKPLGVPHPASAVLAVGDVTLPTGSSAQQGDVTVAVTSALASALDERLAKRVLDHNVAARRADDDPVLTIEQVRQVAAALNLPTSNAPSDEELRREGFLPESEVLPLRQERARVLAAADARAEVARRETLAQLDHRSQMRVARAARHRERALVVVSESDKRHATYLQEQKERADRQKERLAAARRVASGTVTPTPVYDARVSSVPSVADLPYWVRLVPAYLVGLYALLGPFTFGQKALAVVVAGAVVLVYSAFLEPVRLRGEDLTRFLLVQPAHLALGTLLLATSALRAGEDGALLALVVSGVTWAMAVTVLDPLRGGSGRTAR